ncbi:MAG: radical SAM protein [Planctomycetes bacterium]|nr:radical SAM protein [Planctomycetota bacterium]
MGGALSVATHALRYLAARLGRGPHFLYVPVTAREDCEYLPDHHTGRPWATAERSPAEAAESLEQHLRPSVATVMFGGGEPFLRPDLPAQCRRAARGGRTVIVKTFGGPSVSAAAVREVFDAGISLFSVLILSRDHETHNSLFARPGMCRRAFDTLLRARDICGHHALTPRRGRVGALVDVGGRNLDELPDLAAWLLREGVGVSLRAMRRFAGAAPVAPGWRVGVEDQARVERAFSRLARLGRGVKYADHARRGLAGGAPRWPCDAGRAYLVLTPDGSLCPCPYQPGPGGNGVARAAFAEYARRVAAECPGCTAPCWREVSARVRRPDRAPQAASAGNGP